MSNRLRLLTYVVGIGFPAVALALSIPAIIYQAYRLVFTGLALILIGVGMLWTGIIQVQTAKRRGTAIPWWKHYLIVIALFFVCLGGMYLTLSTLVYLQISDLLKNSIAILFILLILGLGFYGIFLAAQQIATNKRPEQPL
jgi:hypothetical protein